MILDAQNILSSAQEVLATAASTNVIDLGAATFGKRSPIGGSDQYVDVTVQAAYTGGTSVQVVLQTDNDEAFGSADDSWTGPAILVAALGAGAEVFRMNLKGLNLSRYIRLNYVVVGSPSTGSLDAHVVNAVPQNNK